MKQTIFEQDGRSCVLYMSNISDSPLIVLNSAEGKGAEIWESLRSRDINLLVVSGLDWSRDLCPWNAPALEKNAPSFVGGADEHLKRLTEHMIPWAMQHIAGKPAFTAIAGYSLAGLFALYALYRCEVFDRAASISGSMWFLGFADFVKTHELKRPVSRVYLSLGDREEKARSPMLKTVRAQTESVAEHLRTVCDDVTFELNPGGHFTDPAERTLKGICALL